LIGSVNALAFVIHPGECHATTDFLEGDFGGVWWWEGDFQQESVILEAAPLQGIFPTVPVTSGIPHRVASVTARVANLLMDELGVGCTDAQEYRKQPPLAVILQECNVRG
jgi:hypothetical protein